MKHYHQISELRLFIIKILIAFFFILLVMYLGKIWYIDKFITKQDIRNLSNINEPIHSSISKEQSILWQDAVKYVNKYVVVEGLISSSYNNGNICFLNFSKDYRRSLTLVIFNSDFYKFPENLENYYYGKKIRVKGKIKMYKDKPEIIISSPDQIEILSS